MKKQLILLLIASAITGNIDAAANRFYNWCVNNRSRIGLLSGAALSSGAAAYYWKNRNQNVTGIIPQRINMPKKEHPGDGPYHLERPNVIECPRTDFEGRKEETIQICGNKPGYDLSVEPTELYKYLSSLSKRDKRTEHEKIEEGLQRRKKAKEEERLRHIEEIIRQRSSSCDSSR